MPSTSQRSQYTLATKPCAPYQRTGPTSTFRGALRRSSAKRIAAELRPRLASDPARCCGWLRPARVTLHTSERPTAAPLDPNVVLRLGLALPARLRREPGCTSVCAVSASPSASSPFGPDVGRGKIRGNHRAHRSLGPAPFSRGASASEGPIERLEVTTSANHHRSRARAFLEDCSRETLEVRASLGR
jgi:hypothetical protein